MPENKFKGIFANPATKIMDRALYYADVLGAPSHVMNAARDLVNQANNVPVKAANAVYNYATSEKPINFKEAYKEADVNPSRVAQLFLSYPKTNTQANYSKEELEAMKDLDKSSTGSKAGQITAVGYKKHNKNTGGQNKYAAEVDKSSFNDPYKVVEWSIGQTSQRKDNQGNKYLGDGFNFDVKDTEMYKNKIKNNEATPVMYARYLMGVLGSKGYDDGTNSATAVQTRIPVTAYRNKFGGKLNYFNFFE